MKISAVFAFAFVALCAFECCVSVPTAHFKPREDPRDAEYNRQFKRGAPWWSKDFPCEPEKENKDKSICYEKYGCFDRHPGVLKKFPYTYRPRLPESPSDVGTKFYMYTRSWRGEVNDSDTNTLRAKFNITLPTIFLIHGWKDNPSLWQLKVKDALLLREDCNVIVVDWSVGASKDYCQSTGNAQLVGAMVGELIKFLISSVGGSRDSAERFYVVGASLGAQTAGFAGDYLKNNTSITLGRITGLDPAGPFFTTVSDRLFRLDPGDAGYVDVIHTDMPPVIFGIIAGIGLGMRKKAGHTDFFVNGGVSQPGCENSDTSKRTLCDHARSVFYYFASIKNQCSWKAHPCASLAACVTGSYTDCDGECPSMGYSADETKRDGTFYLKTTSKEPFCGLMK